MEVVKASLHPQPPPSPSSESELDSASGRATSTDQTQLLRQFDAAQRACVVQQVPLRRVIYNLDPVQSNHVFAAGGARYAAGSFGRKRQCAGGAKPSQDKHLQQSLQNETAKPFQTMTFLTRL